MDHQLCDFRDEETEVWVSAARALGNDPVSASWVFEEYLATTENLHAHRHAWCTLASRLCTAISQTDVDLAFKVATERRGQVEVSNGREWLARWLSEVTLEGLSQREGESLEGLSKFGAFVSDLEDNKKRLRDRLTRVSGNAQAVASITAQLESLNEGATFITDVGISYRLPADHWIITSFVAGLDANATEKLQVPAGLLVKSLLTLAREGGEKIAFISNIPAFIDTIDDPNERDSLWSLVINEIPPCKQAWEHWANYVQELCDRLPPPLLPILCETLSSRFSSGIQLVFDKWIRDGGQSASIPLASASQSLFVGKLDWQELGESEQNSLAAFCLAMHSREDVSGFSVAHRIDKLLDLLGTWKNRNPVITQILVRLLKRLMYARQRSITNSKAMMKEARHQLMLVTHLIADWNLRGTLPKDLATISVRSLMVAENCRKAGHAGYSEVLFLLLFGLPDQTMLRVMREYCSDTEVLEDLRAVQLAMDTLERGQGDLLSALRKYLDRLNRFDESTSFAPNAEELLKTLTRHSERRNVSDPIVESLRGILSIKVRYDILKRSGFPRQVSGFFLEEAELEVNSTVESLSHRFESTVEALVARERSVDSGSLDFSASVQSLKEAIPLTRELRGYCQDYLPLVERAFCIRALRLHEKKLEQRLAVIVAVVEEEDEELARDVISDNSPALAGPGKRFIGSWMLNRYMLRELLPERDRILDLLLDWRFVASWILLPFLAAGSLNMFFQKGGLTNQEAMIVGSPFFVVILANLFLLAAFLAKKPVASGGVSRASLLVPQMVGALFFGIIQSFAGDEGWSAGFLANPFLRIIKITAFVGVSYYFVRYVMIGNQSPKLHPQSTLRQRSLGLISLGMFQSFTLVSLFSLLEAGVMAGPSRADLMTYVSSLTLPQQKLGEFVPNVIQMNLGDPAWLSLTMLPWALISWTVQIFFFSAIFERIMNR